MLHSFKVTLSIGESLSRIPRCAFSLSRANKCVDVAYNRNLDLGRQVFRVFAIEKLHERDDLSVKQIRDVVTGLTYPNQVLKSPSTVERKSSNEIDDMLAEIGRLKMNDDEHYNDLLNTVNDSCLSSLSADDANTLVNSNHPKFLLQHLCDQEGVEFSTESKQDDKGVHHVTVTLGNGSQYTAQGEVLEEATHLACLRTLQSTFPTHLTEIQLESLGDIPLEQDADIRDRDRIRKVVLTKARDEGLGFTIRGGQQKLAKNEKYTQFTLVSPLLITQVVSGGAAERCGLQVGDRLLGVGHHSLKDKYHEQAAKHLQEAMEEDEMEFTVQQDQHSLLVLKAEEKILQRDYDKVKEEMQTPGLREWHAAKSRVDPMEYFLEQYTAGDRQKRVWRASKIKKQNQLWHQYRPKMKLS